MRQKINLILGTAFLASIALGASLLIIHMSSVTEVNFVTAVSEHE